MPASKFAVGCTCILQKLDQQPAHLLRLLLLQPVAGSVDEMNAAHLRAPSLLHGLECARVLEDAPIALAADEQRRHVDGAAAERLQVGDESRTRAPIAVEATLKSSPSIFRGV